MRRNALLLGMLLLAACARVGQPPQRQPAADPETPSRYEASVVILENEEHGPMLCLGMILDSLPPQCGDVPISNWDWEEVSGEKSMAGTTWGHYHVVGTYDGERFTVVATGPPQPPAEEKGDPIDTPCPEPEGGWAAPDPTRASEADRDAARRAAEAEPDFSGLWIDHVEENPDPEKAEAYEPGYVILNVAFTGDVERHTAELRELWGGPLCVVQHERTYEELRTIQKDLEPSADQLDIEVLWSNTSVTENVVEVGVVVIDERSRQAIDQRYGEGAVRVFPALTPAE